MGKLIFTRLQAVVKIVTIAIVLLFRVNTRTSIFIQVHLMNKSIC